MTATFLACLTPPGAGAIATLGLRGPATWTLVRDLSQGNLPPLPQPGRFWLRRLGNAKTGDGDDVVVAVKQLTPEPWVELHCHGGREVIRLFEAQFFARGVQVVTWQEFEQITTADPLRVAALSVLARAPTTRAASIALEQFQGAFSLAMDEVRFALWRDDAVSAVRLLAELERYAPVGRHLINPWRVVIAGAPNVGKSSLVNALAGYQRSVVSPQPGTTRDVVTTLLSLDGWPVEISDTAGWREAQSPLEQQGINRAHDVVVAADLCLWLLDGAAPPFWPEVNLADAHFVVNKSDLPPTWPVEHVDALRVSAQTGTGIADLCQAIASWLVPETPRSGAAIPFTAKLAAGIVEIRDLTQSGRLPEAIGKLENLSRECD